MKILVINPGATSTKIALYDILVELWSECLSYSKVELDNFQSAEDQENFRFEEIVKVINKHQLDLKNLAAVVGRGGLLRPLSGGTWMIDDEMIADLKSARYGSHPSNLGAILAIRVAKMAGGIAAYIVDPVCVDEMLPISKISGIPNMPRRAVFHALNQRAVALKTADLISKKIEECNFIIAHMGGGVTVGAHCSGKVIDVNNALGGYGPMTPDRAGTVHAMDLVEVCFSGKYTKTEVEKMIIGEAGLFAHLGTTDFKKITNKCLEGDEKYRLIVEAFAYQVSCEIGSRAMAMKGKIDAIILTGGLAKSQYLCELIEERVSWLAEVIVSPGEDEQRSLCEGAYRVLSAQEEAKIYEK